MAFQVIAKNYLDYFNGTVIVDFPINLALYLKDLKASVFVVLALKLVA